MPAARIGVSATAPACFLAVDALLLDSGPWESLASLSLPGNYTSGPDTNLFAAGHVGFFSFWHLFPSPGRMNRRAESTLWKCGV